MILQTLQLAGLLEELDRDHKRQQAHKWKVVGGEMRALRQKAGVSLRELARRMNISAPFLSDMERGARHYTQERIASASSALRLPNAPGEPRDQNAPKS